MKIRFYLTLAILFITFNCFANKERIDSSAYIKKSVAELQDSLTSVNKQLADIRHTVEISQNDISSTNSSLSNIIASIGITLALAAIIIGFIAWFVNKRADKAAKTLEEIDLKVSEVRGILAKTDAIKTDVEILSDKVKNNISQLYQDLQDEELRNIFDIIIKHPQYFDIYLPLLRTRHKINKKFIPLIAQVVDSLSQGQKQEFYKLLVSIFGDYIILEQSQILAVYIKDPYSFVFFTDKDVDYAIKILSEKYKTIGLTADEDLFIALKILPEARQFSFYHKNLRYEKILSTFGLAYWLRFEKPNLELDVLKKHIESFFNSNPFRYKKNEIGIAYQEFLAYLKDRNVTYNFNKNLDEDIIFEEFIKYSINPHFFVQDM
ncbi:hypothetical protein LJ707_13315 [Mucilaginibacter sp. UR6-1]|uniref:hypothetical protein n=1 Tax=Mucilaginibacter sp. UR6-1 TaxID=1435643 RepID=UPI001E2B4591|nr:hypothetical protein [Mucilaginibacter sp. UR6-1]MCC8409911.1 hypothetical protein [Mucilaginibacter sp. UR6-1]